MYKHNERQMNLLNDFFLPFDGKLDPNNRWCQLAAIIPWDKVEDRYAKNFKLGDGQRAFSVRVALGALIIQNRKSLTDRNVVEEISENPYMQFFLGFPGFTSKKPFDHSMMVHFRKRLGKDIINEINEMIAKADAIKSKADDYDDNDTNKGQKSNEHKVNPQQGKACENKGTLLLDATCVPADIHYPTDLWLLNKTREALEEIVDVLHKPYIGIIKKPRTYRQKARKDYLNIDKKKHKTTKAIRKAIGKQLRYIKRDLATIKKLSVKSPLTQLSTKQYKYLLVCHEIYRQQELMYRTRTHKIEDRIVSLSMPFIRPIVRGKANANVEFGAKLAISTVNGYSFMEHLSFDAYNEGGTFIKSIVNYYERFGVYPESVIADKIYRTRENKNFCKSHGIRFSGPQLGRPSKDQELLKKAKTRRKSRCKNTKWC